MANASKSVRPSTAPSSPVKGKPSAAQFLVGLTNGKKGKAFACLGFALLLFHLLEFPHGVFDATHDLSSHATFEYYAARGAQFGTEIYQNVGPFGYVHYAYTYNGYLHWQKLALKTFCRLVLVLLIFWMSRCLQNTPAKLFWWTGFLLFYSLGDATDQDLLDLDENLAYVTVYLTGLWLLQDRSDRAFQIVSIALWCFLAFLSLTKHTCFVLAGSIVLAVCAQNLARRHFVRALAGLGIFSIWLAVLWLGARQNPVNLPAFIRGVFAFSNGYNEALAVPTEVPALVLGLSAAALLMAKIIHNWGRLKREFGRPAMELFLLFVIWKHAFVRADVAHVTIFFYAILLFVMPLFFGAANSASHLTKAPSRKLPYFHLAWCAAVILLCLRSFYVVIPDCHYKIARLRNHFRHNFSWIISPLRKTREMESTLRATKAAHALPEVRKAVGRASIDFFGHEPGHLLLNDLNYSSRPMPITFAAANRLLQEANERFYRDAKTAPKFVLCQLSGMDNRFFVQDDALALRALLDNYRPLLMENGLLLFQRRDPGQMLPQRREQPVAEQSLKFDQTVSLDDMTDNILWLEAQVEHTRAGKLLSFFYKAPPCYLGLQIKGAPEAVFYKFVTAMGDCGVMLNPLLASNVDLAGFYGPKKEFGALPLVEKITFACDAADRKFFKDEIRLRFSVLEKPRP